MSKITIRCPICHMRKDKMLKPDKITKQYEKLIKAYLAYAKIEQNRYKSVKSNRLLNTLKYIYSAIIKKLLITNSLVYGEQLYSYDEAKILILKWIQDVKTRQDFSLIQKYFCMVSKNFQKYIVTLKF